MSTRARDKVALVLVCYMVVASGIFATSDIVYDVGAPRCLPLPWSGFHDFIEASAGAIAVGITFIKQPRAFWSRARTTSSNAGSSRSG